MKHFKFIILYFSLLISLHSLAQNDSVPFFKGALKENRIQLQRTLINGINKKLSLPLTEATEEKWMDAFWSMEILQYQSPWVNNKISEALDSIATRSDDFQRALLELCYSNYPAQFEEKIYKVLGTTLNAKNFAIAAEYLYRADPNKAGNLYLAALSRIPVIQLADTSAASRAILYAFENRYNTKTDKDFSKVAKELFKKEFLQFNTVVYSIQRKNRDYPGIAIVKDSLGNFIKDVNGKITAIPQLARSISAMPYYITNGNTPQGIFRMFSFDVSHSNFIGPTANVQLTMPYETTLQHFLNDSTITDSIWTIDWYKKLLPKKLQNYQPLYESFYASEAGRTEIIAHGTTVDPEYYKGKVYYPLTPTQGCLATKEIWSRETGKRAESDQQKLVDTIKLAGGARGYYVVIELDDKQEPVKLEEILQYIK